MFVPYRDDELFILNVVRNEKAEVNVLFGQEISFELWDYDPGFPGVQNDDPLGRCADKNLCFSSIFLLSLMFA